MPVSAGMNFRSPKCDICAIHSICIDRCMSVEMARSDSATLLSAEKVFVRWLFRHWKRKRFLSPKNFSFGTREWTRLIVTDCSTRIPIVNTSAEHCDKTKRFIFDY